MARSITQICNEALGEVPASLITSIDDGSQGARHCLRLYPGVVSDLIELHDWDFANRRVALAAVVNDRPGEWGFAYALPADLGSPRGLVPQYAAPVASVWGTIVCPAYPGGNLAAQWQAEIEYRVEEGKLYTWLENATLDYVSNLTDPSMFTSLFSRAVAMELAARLVMPILNDRQRQGDLGKQSEMTRSRAIADDINRNKRNDLDFTSDRAMARGVGFGSFGRLG